MKLNANTFPLPPSVVLVNQPGGSWLSPHLSSKRMVLDSNVSIATDTSYELSEEVLPVKQNYMGAFVFNDSIHINITVNWIWVKQNIEPLVANKNAITTYANALGLGSLEELLSNGISVDPTTLFPNSNLNPNSTILFLDTILSIITIPANATALTTNVISNITQIIKNTEAAIASSSFDLPSSEVSLKIKSIDIGYDSMSNTSTVTLIDAYLQAGNLTFSLGNVTIALSSLINLLPDSKITYNLAVPSLYNIMHNTTSPHGAAIFNGELTTSAFQQCNNGGNKKAQYLIKNHALPLTQRQALEIRLILSLLAAIFILIPLCYIPAAFVSFIVKERASKAKHIQMVSSVSPYLYWFSTYLWDIFLYLILLGCIMGAFYIYGQTSAIIFISTAESAFAVGLLLFLYGTSILPLSYLYSLLFENHATALISIMAINFFTGFVAVLGLSI